MSKLHSRSIQDGIKFQRNHPVTSLDLSLSLSQRYTLLCTDWKLTNWWKMIQRRYVVYITRLRSVDYSTGSSSFFYFIFWIYSLYDKLTLSTIQLRNLKKRKENLFSLLHFSLLFYFLPGTSTISFLSFLSFLQQ